MAQLEINVVGTFDFQPPLSIRDETALFVKQAVARQNGVLNTDLWAPGTKDFVAVARDAVVCSSFGDVLATILTKPQDSIGRLNIFTHGEGVRISFKGHMVANPAAVDVFFDDYNTGGSLGILDKDALDDLNTPGQWFQVNKNPKRFTLDDIRKRFVSTNPLVVIYACKSGTDPQFIQKLSDTLDVMVDGFKQKIAYCPKYAVPPSAPNIERNRIGMGDCATFVTTNFYELLPFAARRSADITKKPKSSMRTAIPA
jgi:hypothetical protein